jgi:hypothetical protein
MTDLSISVVIPTIEGREDLLARTREAYQEATSSAVTLELLVVRGRPTCGEAWTEGAAAATRRFLHLAADDLEPEPGWDLAGIESAQAGIYPSPRILRPDGSVEACGTLGAGMLLPDTRDLAPASSAPFPFLRRELWAKVGPCPAIHYYADDLLAYRARLAELRVQVRRGYAFTHLEGIAGRDRVVARAMEDRARCLQACADAANERPAG